jgi:uncharacterized protein
MFHRSHTEVINRLKRADGHLRTIIEMIENQRECLAVAQQLHAVEKALQSAKRIYVQDHIDNCLEEAAGVMPREARDSLSEFKEIAKYL